MCDAHEPRRECPPSTDTSAGQQMESCYLDSNARALSDLVDGAGKAAAEEGDPSRRTKTTGCQLGQDLVHELAALERSIYRIAIPEPPVGLPGHAGTIAADASQSVMAITFRDPVSQKMALCPQSLEPIVTT